MKYKAKYAKYITKNSNRFANEDEIINRYALRGSQKATGVPIYYDHNGKLHVNHNSGSHSVIIGPTGCKKTTTEILPQVITGLKNGISQIVGDSKGEIYGATVDIAKKLGIDVKVLDLKKYAGDKWNPLSIIYDWWNTKKIDAENLLDDFIKRIVEPAENKNDKYWSDLAFNLIKALSVMLLDSTKEKKYINVKNVTNLIEEDGYEQLCYLRSILPKNSIAYVLLNGVLVGAKNTRAGIFSTAAEIMNQLVKNEALSNMMLEDTMNISQIAEKSTIVYIIYPDESNTMNFLVNAFLSQAYQIFVKIAENNNGKLPISVDFIIDEFGNMPAIDGMSNRISKARSMNIRYTLCIQSLQQLKKKYNDQAEIILSNCDTWIIFASREFELNDRISKISGFIYDYKGKSHDLLDSTKLQYLIKENQYADAVVIGSQIRPFVSRLYDYRHIKDDYFKDISISKNKIYKPVETTEKIDKDFILDFYSWYKNVVNEFNGFKLI